MAVNGDEQIFLQSSFNCAMNYTYDVSQFYRIIFNLAKVVCHNSVNFVNENLHNKCSSPRFCFMARTKP